MIYRRGKLFIREAMMTDIDRVARDVREVDVADIDLLFALKPEQSMTGAYQHSTHRYSVFYEDRIIAILGLVPDTLLSKRALVWMVTTRSIEECRVAFAKASREFTSFLKTIYPFLYGNVRAENTRSFNWLSWLGADLFKSQLPISYNFTLEEN